MEVVLAKSAGFCFGVKRAMEEVYSQLENGKKIVTYGPLIHNEEVVKDLAQRGVDVIDGEEELEALAEGAVVIRSHGVSKHIYELIEQKGLECIDVTCPFVKRIHRIVERESKEGKQIVIIGNPGHQLGLYAAGNRKLSEKWNGKSGIHHIFRCWKYCQRCSKLLYCVDLLPIYFGTEGKAGRSGRKDPQSLY